MAPYLVEEFSAEEQDVLRRYFTNLDLPVFALVNLPEVVKGALFARYSRSPKSLRRLFLDEFVGELDIEGDQSVDATIGMKRAEDLYERIFVEFGDDSVAQLGGVHLACEQASNLLTKVLEWGRLAAYLEQSTRYIAYDSRPGGRYRYFRDPEILSSSLGTRYVGEMDRLFDAYASMTPIMADYVRSVSPKSPGDSDFVYRMAVKAKALDAVRGVLPAAAQSNVGIYGSGQSYEQLLLRMRAHPLPESRHYADMILTELRKVIPSFVRRVDLEGRGLESSQYMADNRIAMDEIAGELLGAYDLYDDEARVELVDFDPDAEVKMVASMLYPYSHLSERDLEHRARTMSVEDRLRVIQAYTGDRANRRHRPGRALERPFYRFDVLADYGAFRDLQRHRMLTVEWQTLNPYHGYTRSPLIDDAGLTDRFDEAMSRSAELYETIRSEFPVQAAYAISFAYRVRFNFNLNARAAMHTLELRSTPQGHPAYRSVAQQMHRLIGEKAGHKAIAAMMSFVNHSTEADLERLDAERRAEARRAGNTA
ncbi:MAG: thymidylate synthase [Actinomycetia bacterium]|nr:thymidylate synthase [Actinomycetes bacterium]MCP4224803.1 thymidylate synthase [Actinomycetes bacterium]MCP5033454.1 thymidylate synthase [Actinomycetes bacterium]